MKMHNTILTLYTNLDLDFPNFSQLMAFLNSNLLGGFNGFKGFFILSIMIHEITFTIQYSSRVSDKNTGHRV